MFDKANLILLCLFLFEHYPESENGLHRKVKADLNSPRQELSVRDLEFVIALSFICVYWGSNPAVGGRAGWQAYRPKLGELRLHDNGVGRQMMAGLAAQVIGNAPMYRCWRSRPGGHNGGVAPKQLPLVRGGPHCCGCLLTSGLPASDAKDGPWCLHLD